MKLGKHLNKISLYFVLSVVFVVSLTGCGRKKVKINGSYSAWIDAIGINKYSDIYCSGYDEYENGVTLYISPFKFETADEFKKILDNHNAFVTRNPDYFPEDFDINIMFNLGYGDKLKFSNRMDSDIDNDWVHYMDLSEIETEKTHRLRYVYAPDFDLLNRINTKYEAETIILYSVYGTHGMDMSEYFTGFKRIIVDVGSDVEEMMTMNYLREIQQENPDAEIYYKTESSKLTKYVFDENSK